VKVEDLIGTWRLRSWKNVASDGSAVNPLGEKPVGYIFYNHDGYMSVEIMAAHRAPYRDPDAFGGTWRSDPRRSAPTSPTPGRSRCCPTRTP
jgi:Lipocalin-like domain